jgi:hypothetical protein
MYKSWAEANGGITLSEMAQLLRVAARAKALAGHKVGAAALRGQAVRARNSIVKSYRRWPPRRRITDYWGDRWSLVYGASALRWKQKRNRRLHRAHWIAQLIAGRTVLAMTCAKCGNLKQGIEFHRHRRNSRDSIDYIDRRCRNCKWGLRAKSRREDRSDELG